MLVGAPRLRIRRPSPTTAEFTVTTSPPQTLTLRLLHLLLLLIRIAFACAGLLLLHARWAAAREPVPSSSTKTTRRPAFLTADFAFFALDAFHCSPLGQSLRRAALSVPLLVLLPAAATAAYVLSLRVHAAESLLVLRGLGVQTSESPGTYLASTATRFIPTEKIQDILINEAFRGFEVRYYLVVVVEGEEEVVVVFPGLLPRRDIVETVWRDVRECLYEKGREEKGHFVGAS